ASDIELLAVNAGDGADRISVGSLQGSGVTNFSTDLGLSSGLISQTNEIQKRNSAGNLLYLTPEGSETTIQSGNEPLYQMVAARDSNGNARLYAGVVGGTVVDQIEQVSVLTPKGEVVKDDVWTITLTLDGISESYEYTVLAGDTMERIASELTQKITLESDYFTANLVDVITDEEDVKGIQLTLGTSGRPFRVSYDTVAGDGKSAAGGTFAVRETPFEAPLTNASITFDEDIDQNGSVDDDERLKSGEIWAVTLDGIDYEVTTETSDTVDEIRSKIRDKINEAFNDSHGDLRVDTPLGTPSYNAAVIGSELRISNWPQKTYNLMGAVTLGDVWNVVVDTETFTYTILEDDTLESVAFGLAQAIDSHDNYQGSQVGTSLVVVRSGTVPTFTAAVSRRFLIPETSTIEVPGLDANGDVMSDDDADEIIIFGDSLLDDQFEVESNESVVRVTRRIGTDYVLTYDILNAKRSNETADLDSLTIYADSSDPLDIMGGRDTVDASAVVYDLLALSLAGGAGNDRLIGSSFDDVLDSGLGNDDVTGGPGVDTFIDAGGVDTLIETRDWDMSLFGGHFVVGKIAGDSGGEFYKTNQAGFSDAAGIVNINPDTAGTAGDTDQVGIGDVTGVIISDGGSGYTSAATVTFSSAPTGGVTATGTLVIENGVITGVTLTNPGSGYVTPPTINFSKAGPFAIDFLGDPDPQMAGLRDTGDQYYPAGETFETSVAGIDKEIILEVEVIPQVEGKSIFENARITGGDSNNVIVVGDQDNRINVGGSIITTSGWTGRATLDNRVSRINGSSFSEYYIVNLDGNSGGSVVISDSGGTEGFDELYIFGTSDDDEFYLNRAGEDTGRVIAGERFDLTKPYNVEVTGSVKRDKVHLSISNRNPNLPVSLESTTPGTTVIPASNGQGFRFQFTGEVATGSPWNVSVDGIAYNYTARLSDTLYDVARGLQSLIRGVNPQRDTVLYRDVERMTIRTMDGDDSLLSDDTATTVVIEMGRGDDTMSVGSVPQIPDEGNKNLEYPDGVPVADTDNMTNGNSFEMFAFGAGGDDQFEVNHNIAALYLGGGDGDDTFIINTFIALKKNPDRPDDITNLTNLFGGRGSNRYEYVQNAPVFINGGYGTDTMVINGTPIDDQFVITEFYVAGAGRIVYFAGIERLEVNSAGGKDDIYVLSSPAEMEITVRGGSNDDIIYLGGDAPAQVFDPPAFKYQPPPFTVQDPAVMVEEVKIRPAQTIRSTYSWWDTVWGSRGNVSAWALIQAVTDLTTWYASQVAKDPSFRLISHSSINNVIEQMVLTHVEQISSRYWWQFWAPVVKVTYQLPEIRYGISKPVLPEPRVITPAVVEVDPVIFALKSTANYTVADIKGRLVVDGGNDSESDGDKVIVHNEDGTITTGSLTNETIAVKDGERIQAFDSSGDALFDAGVVVREPNQTTLTLSGSVVSGQVYTVKIDTDTNERNGFSLSLPAYTANVADGLDLDSVADELAAIIDNNANYSATTSGSKVIITGQTSADRITRLSATVAEPVNTSGTVTFVPGNSEWEVELSGTVKTGDYWGVNVNDGISSSPIAFDFWSKAGQNSLETVARFLARAIARYPTLNAVAVDRKITITAANPGPIISSVTLQNSAANGRIPIKNTDYRQRYNDNGNPVSRTYVSLQGLALPGGISVDGTSYQGVLIQNIENMDIRLGFDGSDDTKNDRFTFNLSGSETISQRTTLVMGGGDDIANVQAVSGETRILGGSGNDLINVLDAASALGTQFIEGDLNIRDDVQTVLYSELDPLFKEVVDNAPSVFQSEGSSVTKVPIVYRDGDEVWVNVAKLDSRGQIVEVNYQDEINESVGDVAVTRPSPKEWSILFPRSEAGLIEELVVGTQNLVGVSVSGNLTNRRIYQTGTGGTFTLTVNGKTTDAIPYDATAAEVQAALEKVVEGQTGLKAEFFNVGRPISSLSQVDFNATPSYTATVENVNFPKTSGVFPQWPGGPSDRFAVRLTGTIFIPETGTYNFSTTSDDGSILLFDGVKIVDNDGLHGTSTRVGVQRPNLSAGAHGFEVRMFENGGAATLLANWSGPGIPDQLIPTDAFKSGVSVTGAGTPSNPWVVEFSEDPAVVKGDSRNLDLGDVETTSEIQRISTSEVMGTYTLVFRGEETEEISVEASPENLKAALEALDSIEKVRVIGEGSVGVPWEVTFIGPSLEDLPQLLVGPTSSIGVTISTVQNGSPEQIFKNTAIGGTFSLTYNGYTTAPIAYNASATGANSVESSLESLTAGSKLYYDSYGNRTIDSSTVAGGHSNAENPASSPVYDSVSVPLTKLTANGTLTETFAGFLGEDQNFQNYTDRLNVDDSSSTSAVSGRLTPTRIVGLFAEELTYQGLEDVSVTLGDAQGDLGNNFILENSSGASTTLNTGDGNDTVNIIALSGRATISTVTEGVRAGNEVQEISVGDAIGGQFRIGLGGDTTGLTHTQTALLDYNITASDLKAALEGLDTINTVIVNGRGSGEDPWRITYLDPGLRDVPPMVIVTDTLVVEARVRVRTENEGRAPAAELPANNEVQAISVDATRGHFQLGLDGTWVTESLRHDATADQVKSALEARLGPNMIEVTGFGTSENPWRVAFLTPGNVAEISGVIGSDFRTVGEAVAITVYEGRAAVDEVQSLVTTAASGSFTLSYVGRGSTIPISHDADAATVKNAIEELGGLKVEVTGVGSSFSPWLITFTETGVNDVPELIANDSQLETPFGVVANTVTEGGAAVDEIQSISFSSDVTGGTFQLALNGQSTDGVEHPLTFDATAAEIRAALEALPANPGVTVSGSGQSSDPWLINFISPGAEDVAELIVEDSMLIGGTSGSRVNVGTLLNGRAAANEVQTLYTTTTGTFTIDISGKKTDPIAYNAPPTGTNSIQKAIESLGFSVDVSGVGIASTPWRIEFTDPAATNIPPIIVDLVNVVVVTETPGNSSATEVQTVYRNSGVTGGTFVLNFDGRNTSPIAWDATATGANSIESALEALGGFNVDVVGEGTSVSPWKITFSEPSVNDAPTISGDARDLSAPATAVTTINTESGNDVINVGDHLVAFGDDLGTLNQIKGILSINGGTGDADILNLDDGGDHAVNDGILSDQLVAGLSLGGIVYQNLDHLNLWLGTARNTLVIPSTHIGTETIVTGRDGGGVYQIGNATSETPNVKGRLQIDAGAGSDKLIYDNQIDTAERTGKLTGSTITGFDMAEEGVTYSGFEELILILGSGVDKLSLESDFSGTTLIQTGGGRDEVKIEKYFGEMTVETDEESDTIRVFDGNEDEIGLNAQLTIDGGAAGDNYIVTVVDEVVGNSFLQLSDSGVDGLDTLTYNGSDGDDLIQLDTVYDRNRDSSREFTNDRWRGYGNHGDGLIVAHFDGDATDYQSVNLGDTNNLDTDALMAINRTELANATRFQVLNYSTIEKVTVRAGAGNDKIISDDTAQEIDVFGNEGDDQFYVGSVIDTEEVSVEGKVIEVVTEITKGTSSQMNFYGGAGDDYFEVNHNTADIKLYGDNGDDTFFIKALLTLNGDEELVELDSSSATVSGVSGEGSDVTQKGDSDTRQVDVDALVYVQNAKIKIDGGAGFDSVAVVGTVLADTFYVFTEEVAGETVQRIYGAGVKLEELLNIERIQILTGAGDDRVYIYGIDMGPVADMVVNTGTGSDTVYFGGGELTFDINFPTRKRTDYASVDGYQDAGTEEVGDGQSVGLTEGVTRVVAYEVVEPARAQLRVVSAAAALDGILNPVLVQDPEGLLETIVFNNLSALGGPSGTSLVFEERDLDKKRITTDATKLIYPTDQAGNQTSTDLIAQLAFLSSSAQESIGEMINDYLVNQITFSDRYDDHELIGRLLALTGMQLSETPFKSTPILQEQVSILTPIAAASAGEVWTITLSAQGIPEKTFSYQVADGDDQVMIADSLQRIINADPDYVATLVDVSDAKAVKVILQEGGKGFNVSASRTGTIAETITIADGVSYAVFQETLDDVGNTITARMQLDDFLDTTGYVANYLTTQHPDPERKGNWMFYFDSSLGDVSELMLIGAEGTKSATTITSGTIAGVNEVQSILRPDANRGQFTLMVNGVNTISLSANATYQEVENALNDILIGGKVKVTDTDLLYTIESITNVEGEKLAFVEQDREILFDGEVLLDLMGVSLVTAGPVDLGVPSGYLQSFETVREEQWNTLYVDGHSPKVYFNEFEEAKLKLDSTVSSALTLNNARFAGKTFVQVGDFGEAVVSLNQGGSVDDVTILDGGSGYLASGLGAEVDVMFSLPSAGGTAATGTARVENGRIVDVIITDDGSGYISAPTITFAVPRAQVEGMTFKVFAISGQTFVRGGAGDDAFIIGEGSVEQIGSELFLRGGAGTDRVEVRGESLSDDAVVQLEENTLQHDLEQGKLSKVTNALEFTIPNTDAGDLENQRIADQLRSESVLYAQLAALADADDLKAIAVQAANELGVTIESALLAAKVEFSSGIQDLVASQQEVLSAFLKSSLVDYYNAEKAVRENAQTFARLESELESAARSAVNGIFGLWSLWKDQTKPVTKTWFNTNTPGWKRYFLSFSVGNPDSINPETILNQYDSTPTSDSELGTLTLRLEMRARGQASSNRGYVDTNGKWQSVDILLPATTFRIPVNENLLRKINSISDKRDLAERLVTESETLKARAVGARASLLPYFPDTGGKENSVLTNYYEQASRTQGSDAAAITADTLIATNGIIISKMEDIRTGVYGSQSAAQTALNASITDAQKLGITKNNLDIEIDALIQGLDSLRDLLNAPNSSADEWGAWVHLVELQIVPDLLFTTEKTEMENVKALWQSIPGAAAGFDLASSFRDNSSPTWGDALDLFNNANFKSLVSAHKHAEAIAKEFTNYFSATGSLEVREISLPSAPLEEKVSVLIPNGIPTAGDIWTVVLDAEGIERAQFDYVVAAGDTPASIAERLKLLVDANEDYHGSLINIDTDNGAVTALRITPISNSQEFTVASRLTGKYTNFRSVDSNIRKFETAKEFLEGVFDFESFKRAYKADVESLNNASDFSAKRELQAKYEAQLLSLQTDKERVDAIVNRNVAVIEFFLDRYEKAESNLESVEAFLTRDPGPYRLTLSFWFGRSWTLALDHRDDPRYLKAQKALDEAERDWSLASKASERASEDQAALLEEIQSLQNIDGTGLLDIVESEVARSDINLETLGARLDQQYKFLRNLSRVAVSVLSDTRKDQAAVEFEDTSSLIAELQTYANNYIVTPLPAAPAVNGVYKSATFTAGPSGNSVIATNKAWDSISVLSLTGLNSKGIHLGYGDIEKLTVILGGQDDSVRVVDTLAAAGGQVEIHAGAGDDRFEISDESSTIHGIVGDLYIRAGAGENQLFINDRGDLSGDLITQNLGSNGEVGLKGIAPADIFYGADGGDFSKGLEIVTSAGADLLEINGLFGGDLTEFRTSAGDDDIIIRIDSVPFETRLTIYSEADQDIVDALGSPLEVKVYGGKGSDAIYGSEFDDLLDGGSGDNLIIGNLGVDIIGGEDGDDIVIGDNGYVHGENGSRLTPRNWPQSAEVVATPSPGQIYYGDSID
ncbi:PA14 domain-containing protein, partial [Akkermansiaceae bacterium]|nr:PA14 domain-containing protein [Akkermansiaceae bacterium]